MGLFNKKELQRIEELEKANILLQKNLNDLGAKDYNEIQNMIEDLKKRHSSITKKIDESKKELQSLQDIINKKNTEIDTLQNIINIKDAEINTLNIDIEMMDFAIYKPQYNCMNSQEYSDKIKETRNKQKKMIKDKQALHYFDEWTLDGSKTKGRAMNNDNMKMYLRAFNNECDVLISKVRFNNFDKIEERIKKCAEALDKLNIRNKISLTKDYLQLKIEELHLVHEYNCKKQEEKDLMRAAREEEREQAKLQKEIEEARKKITKEQTHYENAKEKLLQQLSNTEDEEKINDIKNKILEINLRLDEISNNLKDIDYREANQRAGYVYVISNIGSFGEGIYKIGMTRRLDPQDRVDELGDASVPFRFDVHAMIFSDDAPKLENALHNAFKDKKVNMINGRKEFFRVSLEEIENVLKENHDKSIEFKKDADAEQYRETIKLRNVFI